ncbi:MAG TPA: bifunctional phosphopantothenoylcysteine decarboxylase/phosphopantothenate--cysteine ligase CoaBC [Candidatus Olsenella pullicola]|nr:bifunctional phosphopantothenoylcysteine decarboxylase/phosphopantothenate--cysteine ligase CoaBC [Candidatus Olsenella pullicola]
MSERSERRPRVLLAVCGGIAAYKACEVLRGLQKAGCDVRVTMTADAERFVGTVSFEALSGAPVATSLYEYPGSAIPHIDLAEWADAVAVVPATANVMAKMACGIADDCLTTTLLACACPVLVAPGMNVHMWQNPATQANVATLRGRGVSFVGPDSGRLACGDVGEGKLSGVEEIVAATLALLGPRDLVGLRVLVNAGPTHEAIDPVRYIANRSTGKMGYAIAEAAARRGAEVTLVSGPTSLAAPAGVRRVDVESAAQMHDATLAEFEAADVAICSAAVADYTPAAPADHKLKKSRERLDAIELTETADILADLCAVKGPRVVVGFAAETDDLLTHAREKLERKGADLIVANDVSHPESTFGADTNRVALVSAGGVEQLDTMPLPDVANAILSAISGRVFLNGENGTGSDGRKGLG